MENNMIGVMDLNRNMIFIIYILKIMWIHCFSFPVKMSSMSDNGHLLRQKKKKIKKQKLRKCVF